LLSSVTPRAHSFNVLLLHKVSARLLCPRSAHFSLIVPSQNLSGQLKHVRGDCGEGYPDADHCRLMVDRLFCSVFLQQQRNTARDELLQIGLAPPPPVDDGIFSSIHRVRQSMGDSADRVLLLLYLLKGDEKKSPTTDSLSLNSTPIRPHHLLPPLCSPPPPPHLLHAASFFIPTLTRHDSLVAIPPLGDMPVTRPCRSLPTSNVSLPPNQASATSDLWLRDPSEYYSASSKAESPLSELFGGLKSLPNALPSTRCYGASIGPVPSLPPLPQLPASIKQPGHTLEDVCNFYSNSITSRDASVQPLENDPAFFFRAFADIDASPPPPNIQTPFTLPPTEPAHTRLLPPSAAEDSTFQIWRDASVLMEAHHSRHQPCALSPLFSMLPSEITSSGALTIITTTLFFSDLTSTVLAWLSPRHQAHIVDESTLHRHCFSAMIGVPSPTFTLNHTSCSLSPSPNLIRLEDVSPAALRNALLPFAHAGTAAFRISLLAAHASSPSSALPFTVKSLIFFARSQLLALCQVSACITFVCVVPLTPVCRTCLRWRPLVSMHRTAEASQAAYQDTSTFAHMFPPTTGQTLLHLAL
jgi:hypothetical protein